MGSVNDEGGSGPKPVTTGDLRQEPSIYVRRLYQLADALRGAHRFGPCDGADKPEGVVYIQVSDTLALAMANWADTAAAHIAARDKHKCATG